MLEPLVIKLDTNLTIEAIEIATGKVVQRERVHNLVTLAGRNMIRDLLYTPTLIGLTHIGVGSGTTAPAAGDTALQVQRDRPLVTKFAAASGKLTATLYLPPTTSANNFTLTEVGIFTAATGGTLFARATHSGIAKNQGNSITYTWDFNINAS
jgi:hypothetical protein